MNQGDATLPPSAAAEVLLEHAGGLHARPAIKLTKLARRYASEILIATRESGQKKDAKSIAQVLSMKVPAGTTLCFSAQGEDAESALAAIVQLVRDDFAGAPASPSGDE